MNEKKQGHIRTLLLSRFLLVTIITVLGIASLPFVKSIYLNIMQDELTSSPIFLQPGDMSLPELILIPAGSFSMGEQDPTFIRNLGSSERKYFGVPGKQVEISEPFYMSKYEITNEQYNDYFRSQQFDNQMEKNSAILPGIIKKDGYDSHPVTEISWRRAMTYAFWLGKQKQLNYRLPTEAEWEYAARAGLKTAYPWGNEIGINNANCKGCASESDYNHATPVGQFRANLYGLYDISGNVWEWTCSAWRDQFYDQEQQCASMENFDARVVRGGSWAYGPKYVRLSVRGEFDAGIRYNGFGFRVMCMFPIE